MGDWGDSETWEIQNLENSRNSEIGRLGILGNLKSRRIGKLGIWKIGDDETVRKEQKKPGKERVKKDERKQLEQRLSNRRKKKSLYLADVEGDAAKKKKTFISREYD